MKKYFLAAGFILSGGIFACNNDPPTASSEPGVAPDPSHVTLTMYVKQTKSASCTGVLLAPRVVLTAAHCVAGKTAAFVRAPYAQSQSSWSTRAAMKDWEDNASADSHPKHNDVAIVYLDTAIDLDRYPQIGTAPVREGEEVRLVRRGFEKGQKTKAFLSFPTKAHAGAKRGFPNNYHSTHAAKVLDTGGPVYARNGRIVGLVSGRGAASGLLYLARIDGVASWVTAQVGTIPQPIKKTPLTPVPPLPMGDGGMSADGAADGGAPDAMPTMPPATPSPTAIPMPPAGGTMSSDGMGGTTGSSGAGMGGMGASSSSGGMGASGASGASGGMNDGMSSGASGASGAGGMNDGMSSGSSGAGGAAGGMNDGMQPCDQGMCTDPGTDYGAGGGMNDGMGGTGGSTGSGGMNDGMGGTSGSSGSSGAAGGMNDGMDNGGTSGSGGATGGMSDGMDNGGTSGSSGSSGGMNDGMDKAATDDGWGGGYDSGSAKSDYGTDGCGCGSDSSASTGTWEGGDAP